MEDRYKIISQADITHFQQQGYVHLKQAFPPDKALAMQAFMWDQIEAKHNVDRHDYATWYCPCCQYGRWGGLNETTHHAIYNDIGSDRLYGAIDDLLGVNNWTKPKGWGAFLVNPPDEDKPAWDIPTELWHWDGNAEGNVNGLLVFTFFSDVGPQGGGTLVMAGSHHTVAQFLDGLSTEARKQKRKFLRRRFYRSHPWIAGLTGQADSPANRVAYFMGQPEIINDIPVRVVELTGEPGDAVLCHSWLFHCRAPNCADVPRFMRTKGIEQH